MICLYCLLAALIILHLLNLLSAQTEYWCLSLQVGKIWWENHIFLTLIQPTGISSALSSQCLPRGTFGGRIFVADRSKCNSTSQFPHPLQYLQAGHVQTPADATFVWERSFLKEAIYGTALQKIPTLSACYGQISYLLYLYTIVSPSILPPKSILQWFTVAEDIVSFL